MKQTRVGIIGIGQSAFRARRDDASYPDLVREAVGLALTDARLELDDIEAVVYSLSPDAMVGIGNAERLGVDAVGARNKRFLRINTGGATGISSVAAAYYHIAAGACDVCMTAGADKVGECGDSQTVLNKIWDPTYERSLPLGTITMLAMSGIRYAHKYGMSQEDMAAVVVKNRQHAAKNPNAHLRKEVTIDEVMASRMISWPIKLFDCCPQSSGGGAMVLASEKYIKDRNLISDLKFSNVLKQFGVDINVLAFRQEINEVLKADTFKVTNYSYFVNVKKMIHDYCRAYLQSRDPALPHTSSAIRVKLSADGTNVGRNITLVNFTIQLIDAHTNSVRNVKTIGLRMFRRLRSTCSAFPLLDGRNQGLEAHSTRRQSICNRLLLRRRHETRSNCDRS